jgi:hypothetical protein
MHVHLYNRNRRTIYMYIYYVDVITRNYRGINLYYTTLHYTILYYTTLLLYVYYIYYTINLYKLSKL